MTYYQGLRCTRVMLYAIIFLISFTANGQTGWQVPPNVGLITDQRFEDIFFLDTNIGHAVLYDGNSCLTGNGGATWDCQYVGNALRSVDFINNIGVIGSLDGKIYYSPNSGYAWADITSVVPDTGADAHRMCGLAHFGNTFYGVGWWGSAIARFFKSTDAGNTWTTKHMDTSLVTGLVDVVFLSHDTGFVTGCKNTTVNPNAANESVILKTNDGGNTWTRVFHDTSIGGRIWKIQFINNLVGFGSIEPYYDPDTLNLVKTTDGGNTWNIIHVGRLPASNHSIDGPQGVGFATEQKGWLGGWFDGIYETINGGVSWTWVQFGRTFNRFQAIDSNNVFAGGQSIYRWRNTDTANFVKQGPAPKPNNTLYPVSPNPSGGKVKIEFDIKYETNVVLEVANVDMRRHVQLLNKRLKPGHYTNNWDGSTMPNGNYIVWLGTDEIPLVQKFTLSK